MNMNVHKNSAAAVLAIALIIGGCSRAESQREDDTSTWVGTVIWGTSSM